MQCCDVDIDGELSEVLQSEPYLLVTSEPGTESSQVFICCEGQVYIESKSVKDALLDLISTYFVFDIVYPKTLRNILLFLQHFVYDLPDQQHISSTLSTLVGNLQKLQDLEH